MTMVLYNRVFPYDKRSCCFFSSCSWPILGVGAVFSASLLFLVYFYLVGDGQQDGSYYSSSMHLTTRYSMEQMREFAFKNAISNSFKPSLYVRWNLSFNRIFEDTENRFDIEADDVIVFIHIQKTAGTTFERFLVRHLNISRPCECNMGKKRCNCLRPKSSKDFWLFSRYSTGWACGLHADFTEMFVSGCVDQVMDRKEGKHKKRRYFYTTFLRDPIERFVSEYSHVERGANWLAARHVCNGRPPTPDQLPMCFNPEVGWEGVDLDEFLSCPFNLAFNRQTRMLADLTLVNCYNKSSMDKSTRESIILESAKNNLRNLAFFGIKERMNESQFLFEKIFDMRFTNSMGVWNKSKSQHTVVTPAQLNVIKERNHLDIELYKFALRLFQKRLSMFGSDQSYDVDPVLNRLEGANCQEIPVSVPFEGTSTSMPLESGSHNQSPNVNVLRSILGNTP